MASTTYARIQDGIVAELFTTDGDITTMFNPSLVWVPVGSSGAEAGWTYAGGLFTAPAAPPPPTQAELYAYANAKAQALLATMKSYGPDAPFLKADRTAPTISDLLAIEQDAATSPSDAYDWVANDNSVTAFTAAQIAALAAQVASDRKAIFAALATASSGIAGGSITMTAEIDALSWPV
jgi:hypothetical protein